MSSLGTTFAIALSISLMIQILVVYFIVRFFELKFNRPVNSWIVLTPLVVGGIHIVLSLLPELDLVALHILRRLFVVIQVVYWPVFVIYLFMLYRILREAV